MPTVENREVRKAIRKKAAKGGARKRGQVKGVGKGNRSYAVPEPLGPLPTERVHDRRSKHPWGVIRQEYIEGIPSPDGEIDYPTMDALAAKYGMHSSMLRSKASEEQWTKRREVAQANAIAERRRARMKELAGYSTDIDEKAIKLSQLGLNLVTTRLAEIARDAAMRRKWFEDRQRLIDAGRIHDASDRPPDGVDAREMGALASAATTWHQLGRQALGEDVTHIEVSGPGGGPIGVINAHLAADDPDRLVDVVAAMQRAGILEDIVESGQVVDGQVVSDVTEPAEKPAESPSEALAALTGGADTDAGATTSQPTAEGDGESPLYDDGDLDPEALDAMARDAEEELQHSESEYDIAD